MLTIGKLGRGQERYYLEQVAEGAEDYYSGEGEAAGYWLGDAAEELGLQGRVDPKQLTAMLTGRNPVDGSPLLGMRGVPTNGAVPGFDLTFSAPKSVSLLWGLGGQDTSAAAVIAAHERSLAAALGYLQREACWTRRGAGGHEFVLGSGFLAAAYRHRSSRNGDPQLHTHVLIANATKGPDGRWTRLYHPAIYNHAKTASYLYEANLRHELTRTLGVEWQPLRKGIAEIAGFADHHLREFSTRRAEILKAAGGADASARARQVANLATRATKEDSGLSTQTLRERWAQRAQEIGLDRPTLEATLGREREIGVAALTFDQLGRAVTVERSHFERRDAIQAVAGSLPNGAPAHEVERIADAFLRSEAVIPLALDARTQRYTTRRIWELEREALVAAERLRSQAPALAGEAIAARVLGAHPALKADQREMVGRLLTRREGIAIVIGEAGTGKTYATLAAAEGWAQAGVGLRAAAPTWRAANALRAEGLQATSIAALLAELERKGAEGGVALVRGSVLLIDEAGMVDSATLARLIDHVERSDAKLVLIGDPAQLGEIEAGGLFASLAHGADPIVLHEVIRHRHEADREAAKRIRAGEGREALDLYRSEERVVVAPDTEARREAMIRDWQRSFEHGEDAVMIAKRNAEVQKLNAMAREVRRQEGRLGGEEIEVGEARFAAGDQIITRVNDRANEIYNRERWRVAEVDAEQRRLILEGIDQARRVEVDAVYLAQRNPHSEAPAIEHGYAMTTYCAQGATVDRAFVCADPSMDKQELYVAASRAREETFLYATPEVPQAEREEIAPRSPHLRQGLEHIAEAAERDRAQTSAHEEALTARFSALPTAELVARHAELEPAAQREQAAAESRRALVERIAAARERLARFEAQREAAQRMGRRERADELARIEGFETHSREALARMEGALGEMTEPGRAASEELAVVEGVLGGRRQLAVTAARLAPPDYIRAELGERPTDPAKSRTWERGVELIEGYRQERGVTDRHSALGPEPQKAFERAARERRENRLRQIRGDIGHEHVHEHAIEPDHSLGIGR